MAGDRRVLRAGDSRGKGLKDGTGKRYRWECPGEDALGPWQRGRVLAKDAKGTRKGRNVMIFNLIT